MSYKIFTTINYRVRKKPIIIKKDFKIGYKIQKLKYKYLKEGLIKKASIIMLVLKNSHPCLLTLKISYKNFFLFCCNRLINKKSTKLFREQLGHIQKKVNFFFNTNMLILGYKIKFHSLLGIFMRKNFESNFFPYFLPHINSIKELRYLMLFQLPKKMVIGVKKYL